MNDLPHLREIFDKLRRGFHLSPDDEPAFSAVAADFENYAAYFAPLGLTLVRHPREFFYFQPDSAENITESLPRIAVFSFILIDYAANQGGPIEEFLFGPHFLISKLPHFTLDRYAALLRQVEVEDAAGLRQILRNMERLGWARLIGEDEFRFLRPFHRVLDKCLEIAAVTPDPAATTATSDSSSTPASTASAPGAAPAKD